MNEEFKYESPLVDFSLLGESRNKRLPQYETVFLSLPENENDYVIDISHFQKMKSHKQKIYSHNPENIQELYKKNSSIKNYEDLNIIEIPKYEYEIIKPKSELLGRSLGNFAIKSFIHNPQSQNNQLLNQLPASLLNGGNVQQQFNSLLGLGATSPEDLPELALPILEFIEEIQPHIVIGCDRGGRLFALAMHAAWRETRDGRPFPTLDGKLHFARVSKSEDPDVLQEKIDQIVETSKRFGQQRDNRVGDDEQLRVLFVDDWVIGGGTMRLAQRLMKRHNAQTYFAVMCGQGADATGNIDLGTHVTWHDRPEEIGVNYLSSLQENSDGTITQKLEVIAVQGVEATRNRQRIQQAARQLAPARVLEAVA